VLADALPISHSINMHTHTQRHSMKTGECKPGSVMEGFIAGKVLESNSPDWKAGDLFGSKLPFATVQAISGDELKKIMIWKLTDCITEDQISLGVGILGMPGSTAYGGTVDVLRPKEGETIFVSAACGAVGSMVGQIAKNVYKCTVIGSCGGPNKCDLIKKKFSFDHAIDYKQCKSKDDLIAALKAAAPDGIDMYYEVSVILALCGVPAPDSSAMSCVVVLLKYQYVFSVHTSSAVSLS
jgi:NADPH-dependent curcumin reductase CurA